MSSPPQHGSDFTFPWSVDQQPQNNLIEKLERFYRLSLLRWRFLEACRQAARPRLTQAGAVLDQTMLATALIVVPKVMAGWDRLRPALVSHARALRPFLPLASEEDDVLAADPAWEILAEFQALAPDQQDKAARNLALLWDHFEHMFGGLSGFLAEPAIEQSVYLDKLTTASRRMKLARGSEVAFHYVTVELMRLYVSYLQLRRSDRPALALAANVVALISCGRMATPAITSEVELERAPHAQAA
ncbi:FUSC family protein [Microvirga sp. Mcv34]|uniref:FUSC family protein n=1 Tax=Microvirga sp. Mcv34 TaxID=2926016 RepID=UPI0021C83E29|nr:FUSC family protein [Microvirga sp. Mcv34]